MFFKSLCHRSLGLHSRDLVKFKKPSVSRSASNFIPTYRTFFSPMKNSNQDSLLSGTNHFSTASLSNNLNSISDKEKTWFVFSGHHLLLTDQMELPKGNNPFLLKNSFLRQISFSHSGTSFIAAELLKDTPLPKEFQFRDLIELFLHLPKETIAPAGKARQLLEWDKAHQFCGECGSKTIPSKDEYCRTCIDTSCKRIVYPRISPVVMVAVERGEEILMARSPHFPPGIYGMIAGFVEAGETIEQAVKREVFEETGIEIDGLQYVTSQPWPRPNELVLGFKANYKSGNITCDPKEIEHAAFFHYSALPKTFPGNVSILKWLLNDFCERHEKKQDESVHSRKLK